MAVTKTHPIKSTLKAAIDKGTHLGRHMIQAFEPGEVSPEEAHEIGMQLAKEILGGKYEFVLTTHIDKGHIHNHLIFNAVSFTDHKHHHSNRRSYHEIRRASDRLCKEHGLSVVVPGRDKGKSYIEHQAAQNSTSYKAKLKAAIDRLIPVSSSLEDLLARLQREGYEIKRGKYISARALDQERFTRHKAQYSLDCEDGIEYSACLHEPTPQEVLELKERFIRLWNALNSLPEIQGRRIDAHIILGKSIKEIAETEGVHEESVRQSIKRGLERMKKTF